MTVAWLTAPSAATLACSIIARSWDRAVNSKSRARLHGFIDQGVHELLGPVENGHSQISGMSHRVCPSLLQLCPFTAPSSADIAGNVEALRQMDPRPEEAQSERSSRRHPRKGNCGGRSTKPDINLGRPEPDGHPR